MSVFTFHLAEVSPLDSIRSWFIGKDLSRVKGLIHSEYMTGMTLGAPLLSRKRILLNQAAVFIQWENEKVIDEFLSDHSFGKKLNAGWHCRLSFLRQWGSISEFDVSDEKIPEHDESQPVVAVTLARMKLFQVPRFINWGRPAEKLVRDHPGTTLSMAAIRFPRTVSTFSIWKTQKEMTDMAHGHSKVNQPKRHINAMKERDRKDFHFEFTTLRFKPLGEFGEWKGQRKFLIVEKD